MNIENIHIAESTIYNIHTDQEFVVVVNYLFMNEIIVKKWNIN